MGKLTTITIYNDSLDSAISNFFEFRQKVIVGGITGYGNYGSLKVQRARDADDPTLYVHMGGTVVEMNHCARETTDLMTSHPEFFKSLLNYTQSEARELKRQFSAEMERKKTEAATSRLGGAYTHLGSRMDRDGVRKE